MIGFEIHKSSTFVYTGVITVTVVLSVLLLMWCCMQPNYSEDDDLGQQILTWKFTPALVSHNFYFNAVLDDSKWLLDLRRGSVYNVKNEVSHMLVFGVVTCWQVPVFQGFIHIATALCNVQYVSHSHAGRRTESLDCVDLLWVPADSIISFGFRLVFKMTESCGAVLSTDWTELFSRFTTKRQ